MSDRVDEFRKTLADDIKSFVDEERMRRRVDAIEVVRVVKEAVPLQPTPVELLEKRVAELEAKLGVVSAEALTKQDLPPMSVDGTAINPLYCGLRTPHNALLQQYGSTFPTSPKERDTWYRTDLNEWYLYNGTSWSELTMGIYELQSEEILDQTNPVSGTKYTVLDTTVNARVIIASLYVTWTVQPTPLELHITVDGNVLTWSRANPVTSTNYTCRWLSGTPAFANQALSASHDAVMVYVVGGRSVKVEAETTGGTVSKLYCRLKYEKIP